MDQGVRLDLKWKAEELRSLGELAGSMRGNLDSGFFNLQKNPVDRTDRIID